MMHTDDRKLFTTGDGWVTHELPEDAGVIQETRDGYSVALDGKHVSDHNAREDAEVALAEALDRAKFWPDCFYVNERGNVDQLIPT